MEGDRGSQKSRSDFWRGLEVRMTRLEGSYEQLVKRLGDLAAGLHALRAEFR